ncbi:zinc finger protein 260-like [Ostrinia nubilalis]|uniref:zinc finger protein 260-like n=1 Tax=Ostrinia nubilalis TaxID=29057 RepID=UPI0030824792
MAEDLDLKLVLKHLANGTICENLCIICLKPLTDDCENIFTKICKEDKEYCIADVLRDLCNIKISDTDHYNACSECFIAASNAYKFYVNTLFNDQLLHYYADELESYLKTIDMADDISGESICISLPVVSPETSFDYDIQSQAKGNKIMEVNNGTEIDEKEFPVKSEKPQKKSKIKTGEEDFIIVSKENEQSTFYKMQPNGTLTKLEYKLKPRKDNNYAMIKKRKKREPMTSKKCTRCPIKYRFTAKLKQHMRKEHGVTLYSCKVCDALTEDQEFHKFHIQTHTNIYRCDICTVTFKKRDAIINHMKEHAVIRHISSDDAEYVCMQCGMILADEKSLLNHTNANHYKKYACYYCGRVYKGKVSYDKHIEKHEMYTKAQERRKQQEKRPFTTAEAKKLIAANEAEAKNKDYTCELCGRGFLGQRALLWHSRLHTNERPFTCDTCGRGFVSVNRRNQHALTAHTAPLRRCPLCPARFHLRSMVYAAYD